MFNGSVDFVAGIKGNGLMFPSFDFTPNEPYVDRVTLRGSSGHEVRGTVHLASVATEENGRALADRIMEEALNRLAFLRQIAIGGARRTGDQFYRADQPTGVHAASLAENLDLNCTADAVLSVSAESLKTMLEAPSQAGEHNFGLFRSAIGATSPVEQFMCLYQILLMLHNDEQRSVDSFVRREEPQGPETQSPQGAWMETIYTRLRNELAHRRPGVNLDNTKSEMAGCVGELRALTKRAIELHP